MSSAGALAGARPAPRLRVSEVTFCAAMLALVVVALALLTRRTWGDLGQDTGYDLVAASRIAHGELPYRDFVYFYGPLSPFALGLAAFLGGAGLAPAVWFGLAVSAAIVAATFALVRAYAGSIVALVAGTLVAAVAFLPTNFSYVLPHTESATLGTLLLLGVLLALRRYASSGELRLVVLAGLLGGFCALTRLEVEVAFLAGAVAWLGARALARDSYRRELPLLFVPALSIPLLVYGALAATAGLRRLVLDNLYPVATLRAAGDAVIRLHAPLTLASGARLLAHVLVYAGGLLVLGAAARAVDRRVAPAVLVVGGAALGVLAVLARPGSFQYWSGYAYAWLPAGAVLALAASLRKRDAQLAAEGAVLAALAATTYAAFQLQATRAQPAVYAAPFAALLLARLHAGATARRAGVAALGAAWLAFLAAGAASLTLHLAGVESSTVRGPGGAVAAAPGDVRAYQGAVDWIDGHSRPGEPVLLAPQLTALYTLTGRVDPVPQISLLPGALPHRGDELALIRLLERDRVRIAVVDRRAFPEYGHTSFGGSFDRTLAAWIHRTFRHVAALGAGSTKLDIWVRRSS